MLLKNIILFVLYLEFTAISPILSTFIRAVKRKNSEMDTGEREVDNRSAAQIK